MCTMFQSAANAGGVTTPCSVVCVELCLGSGLPRRPRESFGFQKLIVYLYGVVDGEAPSEQYSRIPG